MTKTRRVGIAHQFRRCITQGGRCPPYGSRRGGVYVAVMGVAMIVAVIGLASMQIARIETRAAMTSNDMACAHLMAQSGIAFAVGRIDKFSSTWRTLYTHGAEEPASSWINMGTCGRFKFILLDASGDADLADDASDSVTIRAIGRAGGATSVATVEYIAGGTALTCLEAALHTNSYLQVSGTTITTDQEVSGNADIDVVSGGSITGDVWSAGNISGTVTGNTSSNQSLAREMPNASTVFDYYVANGTPIDINDIPSKVIDRVVLSPGNNPYGAGTTNQLGIYVIDCQGQTITIQDSRLQATLVILNPGSSSNVDKDIYWEPVAANYPALLVEGDIEMKWHAEHNLREFQFGINYNPPGTPYLGMEDGDATDTYPGVIKGLVYVSGQLTISHQSNYEGVVVCDQLSLTADATFYYSDAFLNNPPPGFAGGNEMQLLPGSWQRTAY